MNKLSIITISTIILLAATTVYSASVSNQSKAEKTFQGIKASIIDTGLAYDYNHTAGFTLNATLSNSGPSDISLTNLRATVKIDGRPVYTAKLDSLSIKPGGSDTIPITGKMLRVPDADGSIYVDLKTGGLKIVVDIVATARVNDVTQNVTFEGTTTTGFMHPPGTGLPGYPIVTGPIDLYVDRHILTSVNLEGRLTSLKFNATVNLADTPYNGTFNALALVTADTPPRIYVILSDSQRPVAFDSTDYSDLKALDRVYLTGTMFHYKGWDGKDVLVVKPVDIGASKPIDFVGLAKARLISVFGEMNYDRSFFSPVVYKFWDYDIGAATGYEVEYLYPVWGGDVQREFYVRLRFATNGTFTGSDGVPKLGNLAPYSVDAAAAKKLALDAGLPRGSYPLEVDFRYVGHPDFGPTTAWEDTYIWEVRAWIDPPDSNPRSMNFAVVDPSSGVVYEIGKLSIGYINTGP